MLHEKIHMLCVNDHSTNPSEREDVMYWGIDYGQRKLTLTESDKQRLRDAGYDIVPAPGTPCLLAVCCIATLHSRRRG